MVRLAARERPRVVAWALVVLASGFGVVHLAWALGWRAGVPADVAPIADRPVFLAYDLLAALLMMGAAVVAAVLARGGLPERTTDPLLRTVLVGSVLALLRGAPALLLDVVAGSWSGVGPWADGWFVLCGLLGLRLWWGARPAAARGGTRAPAPQPRPAAAS